MQYPFTKTGGALFGLVNASWPLAKISASADRLIISAGLLGSYTFTPEQVFAVERYVVIPVLAWGIQVRHQVRDYPQRIIFWSLGKPEALLDGLRDCGFIPAAVSATALVRHGIPVRWSAIVCAIVMWNALFMLPFAVQAYGGSAASGLILLPLYAALALLIATLKSPALQRLVLKPDRSVGEIRPFLRLLTFVCGLLAVIFSILVATGAFNPVPNTSLESISHYWG